MSSSDQEHSHVAAALQTIADTLIAKDAEIARLKAELERARDPTWPRADKKS